MDGLFANQTISRGCSLTALSNNSDGKGNGEWQIGRDVEGNGSGLIGVTFPHFPAVTE